MTLELGKGRGVKKLSCGVQDKKKAWKGESEEVRKGGGVGEGGYKVNTGGRKDKSGRGADGLHCKMKRV